MRGTDRGGGREPAEGQSLGGPEAQVRGCEEAGTPGKLPDVQRAVGAQAPPHLSLQQRACSISHQADSMFAR